MRTFASAPASLAAPLARALVFALVAPAALSACSPKVASLDLTPATFELGEKGEARELTAVPRDARSGRVEDQPVRFASSDPKVATVDADGRVTAVSSGQATVTATCGPATASAKVTVSIPGSIAFAPAAVRLAGAGQKARVLARVLDGRGQELPRRAVSWRVEDPAVARVAGGEVIAVGPGRTRAFARAGALEVPLGVEVVGPAVARVELGEQARLKLERGGQKAALRPVARDAAGAPVADARFTFACADPRVATVDEAGVVTAVGKGRTTVTVTAAEGGPSAEAAVEVRK